MKTMLGLWLLVSAAASAGDWSGQWHGEGIVTGGGIRWMCEGAKMKVEEAPEFLNLFDRNFLCDGVAYSWTNLALTKSGRDILLNGAVVGHFDGQELRIGGRDAQPPEHEGEEPEYAYWTLVIQQLPDGRLNYTFTREFHNNETVVEAVFSKD